jgi:integrase/recombinase XerD
MATVKIVLRKKQNKDGSFPLAIRITKDRKTSFIHIGYSIKSNEWDNHAQKVKKNHPNSARLNNYLIKKLSEANDKSLELETQKNEVSSFAVKNKIKPATSATFFTQVEVYLENLKTLGKYNQYTADKSRLNNFKTFLEGRNIYFTDITVSLLEKLKIY